MPWINYIISLVEYKMFLVNGDETIQYDRNLFP